MTDEELGKAPGKLLHIPTTLGAVVLTYNLDGIKTGLKLSPEVLAGIFLGDIKSWDDPKIKADNAALAAPPRRTSPSSTAPTAAAPPRSSPSTSPRSAPTGRRRSARARA